MVIPREMSQPLCRNLSSSSGLRILITPIATYIYTIYTALLRNANASIHPSTSTACEAGVTRSNIRPLYRSNRYSYSKQEWFTPQIRSRLHHPTTLAPPRNKSGNRRTEETDLRLPDSPLISGRHYRRLIAVAQRECDHTPIALRILRIACYELRLDGVIGSIQQVLYTEPHREGTETISPLKGEQ